MKLLTYSRKKWPNRPSLIILGLILLFATAHIASNTDTIFADSFESALNLPPVVDAGADIESMENDTIWILNASADDTDGLIVQHQWQQISGPEVSFPDPSYAANSRILLIYLPPVDGDTDVVLRLTVTDNNGATASDELKITILEYIPPLAHAGADQVVALGDSVILMGSTDVPQPGNYIELRFQWTQLTGTPATIRYGQYHQHIEVTPVVQGETLDFELIITDRVGTRNADVVSVSVVAPGSGNSLPPIANAGVDHVSLAPRMLHLDASASYDPDGSIVEYHWEIVSSPGGNSWVADISPDPLYYDNWIPDGVYQIRLTVTDNTGAMASDEVTITVPAKPQNGNQPPVVDSGTSYDHSVSYRDMDDEYNLNGTASDPDGSIVSTQWYQVSGPVATALLDSDQSSARFVFAPYKGLADGRIRKHEHIFLLVATDDQGASTADRNLRYITYVNSNPFANIDNQENPLMLAGTSRQLSGIYSYDPDNFIERHQWSQYFGPTVSFLDSTTLNPTIMLPQINGFAGMGLNLTVTDRDGGVDTGSGITWVVSRTHQAQNFEAGENLLVSPGETVKNS